VAVVFPPRLLAATTAGRAGATRPVCRCAVYGCGGIGLGGNGCSRPLTLFTKCLAYAKVRRRLRTCVVVSVQVVGVPGRGRIVVRCSRCFKNAPLFFSLVLAAFGCTAMTPAPAQETLTANAGRPRPPPGRHRQFTAGWQGTGSSCSRSNGVTPTELGKCRPAGPGRPEVSCSTIPAPSRSFNHVQPAYEAAPPRQVTGPGRKGEILFDLAKDTARAWRCLDCVATGWGTGVTSTPMRFSGPKFCVFRDRARGAKSTLWSRLSRIFSFVGDRSLSALSDCESLAVRRRPRARKPRPSCRAGSGADLILVRRGKPVTVTRRRVQRRCRKLHGRLPPPPPAPERAGYDNSGKKDIWAGRISDSKAILRFHAPRYRPTLRHEMASGRFRFLAPSDGLRPRFVRCCSVRFPVNTPLVTEIHFAYARRPGRPCFFGGVCGTGGQCATGIPRVVAGDLLLSY